MLLSHPVPEGIVLFRNRVAHMVRVDDDGRHFVDYLGYDPLVGDFGLQHEIANILEDTKRDLRSANDHDVRDKLHWLEKYVSSSFADMTSASRRLERNCGTRFGEVFTRSPDNIVSWAESRELLVRP